MSEIKVPALGESITEAVVGSWLKAKGDVVEVDEILVELETDKITVEVPSPVAGVLSDIVAGEGKTVPVGAVIAKVEEGAGAKAAQPETKAATQEAQQEKVQAQEAPQAEPQAAAADKVRQGEIKAGPAARRETEALGVDLKAATPGGGRGTITPEDVQQAAKQETEVQEQRESKRTQREGGDKIVKMSRLRLKIAERLKYAQNTAAILTTFNEINMDRVIELRARHQEHFQKTQGIKLGFMSFFIKAAVAALKQQRAVNAEIDGNNIVYHNHYDIGIAVGAPQGLVVPVLRDASEKSFAEIEIEVADYGKKAREGRLSLDEITGGTFTITNGGIFGSLLSTPILNTPQSAILGLHKIEERPIAQKGEVKVANMMYVALSYDHRLVDGREAVSFLTYLKDLIEDPGKLLLV